MRIKMSDSVIRNLEGKKIPMHEKDRYHEGCCGG